MDSTMVWVLLIGGAIYGAAFLVNRARKQKAIDGGHAVERKNEFFKQRHSFTTTVASVSEIAAALDMAVLNERNVIVESSVTVEKNTAGEKTSDKGIIVFRNTLGSPCVSVLQSAGTEGGRFRYDYQVESYKESSRAGPDLISVNVILTQIEKAFMKLDGNTDVERTHAQYKSK